MEPIPCPICRGALVFIISVGCLTTGCHSIGPGTVARDRSDYSTSIAESWKRQTLLNIVKLRYVDTPVFVDVGQIVAGYQLQVAASVGGQIFSENSLQANSLNLGGAATYIDRPTVTYTPLTGNKFIKGLMTPFPPESVFFTIQSGWPADAVLFAAVAEVNGLKNQSASISGVSPPAPDFLRVLQLMRKIQLSGAVAMRVKEDAAKQQSTLLTFRSKDISPEVLDDIRELRQLLHLDPDAQEFKLVFGSTAADDKEVAILTRSILQILGIMASQVEVPPTDVAQGSAAPGWESVSTNANIIRLIQVHCAAAQPAHAFVDVYYRGHWFWIDDRDLKSKRAFSFMMLLFTLADTGEKEPLPLVTIPAQ